MRKLLAVVLMGGALIVSASAAFAQDNMGAGQSGAVQNSTGPYVVDQQTTPFAPNQGAQ